MSKTPALIEGVGGGVRLEAAMADWFQHGRREYSLICLANTTDIRTCTVHSTLVCSILSHARSTNFRTAQSKIAGKDPDEH